MIRYLLVITLSLVPASAFAVPLTFTVDSSQSYLSLAVFLIGGDVISTPQTPGSDRTNMLGSVQIDVTNSTLQFLGGADIVLAEQSEPQSPLIDGQPGTAPAQFGLAIDVPGLASGTAAGRNYVGEATSNAIARVGDTFDGTQVLLNLPTADTAYNVTILGQVYSGAYNEVNIAPNLLDNSSLTLVGDLYTLTFPFYIEGYLTVGGVDVGIQYAGQLIATSVVPEPSGWLLAFMAACSLIAHVRFRDRRRHV